MLLLSPNVNGFGCTLIFRPGEARRAFGNGASQWLASAASSPPLPEGEGLKSNSKSTLIRPFGAPSPGGRRDKIKSPSPSPKGRGDLFSLL